MNLNRRQRIGAALTAVGFIVAALASLFLATQAAALGAGGVLIGAGLSFAIILPLAGYGIYLYAQGSQEEPPLDESMAQQVRLMDMLRSQNSLTLDTAARELGISDNEVLDMVQQLAQLDLFTGSVTPQGKITLLQPLVLQALERCGECQTRLTLRAPATLCPQCQTEYFLPRSTP